MTPDEFLADVLAADEHVGGLRCLRVHQLEPDYFAGLRAEVDRLVSDGRPSDVTNPSHVTNWVIPFGTVKQFSLLNTSGRYDDFSDDHDTFAPGKSVPHPADHPALTRFVSLFPDAVNFRLNLMGPDSGLSPHEEHVLTYAPDGSVVAKLRFHLPVRTSCDATLVLDGDVFTLELGVVHFVNHGCLHAAANRSSEPRAHLVWDMLLTRRSFELLFGESKPPAPLERVPAGQRSVTPIGRQRQGAARRLPPTVAAKDRNKAALFAHPSDPD